jgi:PiT family inorganic phosphate transporter
MGPAHSISDGVNWTKALEVCLALLASPVIGFMGAAALLLLAKKFLPNPDLYRSPDTPKPPPKWIRGILLFTCTGVSFAHGSNDGQKGMGLIMLILVGILPGTYALNLSSHPQAIGRIEQAANVLVDDFEKDEHGVSIHGKKARDVLAIYMKSRGDFTPEVPAAVSGLSQEIEQQVRGLKSLEQINPMDRGALRTDMYLVSHAIVKMDRHGLLDEELEVSAMERQMANASQQLVNFIPLWVKVAVALALGLGTMVGYQRIVKTVGERIGKQHLSYAQGASAEAMAMGTIVLGDHFGLPVSTTHVLSSGVAGTMAANHSGVQMNTVRSILMAWVLTLPVCTFLGALLFALILNLMGLSGLK